MNFWESAKARPLFYVLWSREVAALWFGGCRISIPARDCLRCLAFQRDGNESLRNGEALGGEETTFRGVRSLQCEAVRDCRRPHAQRT
eukprot:6213041-Pleurochrysis_carterae.AAC.2